MIDPVQPPVGYSRTRVGRQEWLVREDCAEALIVLPVGDAAALAQLPGARPLTGRAQHWGVGTAVGRVVVRSYRRGGVLGRFVDTWHAPAWAPPRPVRELAVSVRARERGIATPEVLAAVWEGNAFAGYRAWVIVRELDNATSLAEFWDTALPGAERRQAISAAGEAVASLHEAGISHADLNASNILLQRSDTRWTGWIIDLDRARRTTVVSPRARAWTLWRLYRSCRKHLGAGAPIPPVAPVQFLTAYVGRTTCPAHALIAALRATGPWARAKWWVSDHLGVSRPAAPHTVSCTTSP